VAPVLQKKIRFLEIGELIERTMEAHKPIRNPGLEDILEADCWARETVRHLQQMA